MYKVLNNRNDDMEFGLTPDVNLVVVHLLVNILFHER